MELDEALDEIREIRLRMARAELFTGYRAAPTAISGVLAVVAGLLQSTLLPEPVAHLHRYVALWGSIALLGAGIAGLSLWARGRLAGSRLKWQTTWLVVEQMLPALAGGALVTAGIYRWAPHAAALLPGLWQLFFALGIFGSCRHLPRGIVVIGCWYLATGFLCLRLSEGAQTLAPWLMAVPFGVGQIAAGAILYWTLERWDGRAA